MPDEMEAAAAGLTDEEVRRPETPGKWSNIDIKLLLVFGAQGNLAYRASGFNHWNASGCQNLLAVRRAPNAKRT